MNPVAADWGERAWQSLSRRCLRQDRSGRITVREYGRRADAWTLSQVLAAAQVRALTRPDGWVEYEGLQQGLADHLYRGFGYVAVAGARSPEVYYDDNGWIGLALVGAVLARWQAMPHLAPETLRDLATARLLLRLQRAGEDVDRGGVLWRVGGTTRNACSTGPAGLLALRVVEAERALALPLADHDDQLAFARRCAGFLDRLVDHDGMVRDHERADGTIEPAVFSYNQGTAVGLRLQLYRAGGAAADLARAGELADAAVTRYHPGDETSALWRDCPAFVSILVRHLALLHAVDRNHRRLELVDAWRAAVERSARDRAGRYVRGGIATYGRHHALDQAGVAHAHSARALPDRLVALLT